MPLFTEFRYSKENFEKQKKTFLLDNKYPQPLVKIKAWVSEKSNVTQCFFLFFSFTDECAFVKKTQKVLQLTGNVSAVHSKVFTEKKNIP